MTESRSLPRLMILAGSNQLRGAEVFTQRLHEGLAANGWDVSSVALRDVGGQTTATVEPLVVGDPGGGRFRVGLVKALRARMSELRPEILLANGGPTLRYAVAASLRRDVQVGYIAVGEPLFWARSRLSRSTYRMLLSRTDFVMAVSEETRRQIVELYPPVSPDVVVAHQGVPERFFTIEPHEPQGPLRVLWVGSLSGEKDPNLALETVAGVPDSVLRFVGEGPLREALETEAEQMSITERVEFTGVVADVSPHLAWADLILLTSRTEGLPAVLMEAAAAGVPAVTVGVGGVADVVEAGVSGLIVARDPDQLAAAITRLAGNREELRAMGAAGRRLMREGFRLEDAIRRYERALFDRAGSPG